MNDFNDFSNGMLVSGFTTHFVHEEFAGSGVNEPRAGFVKILFNKHNTPEGIVNTVGGIVINSEDKNQVIEELKMEHAPIAWFPIVCIGLKDRYNYYLCMLKDYNDYSTYDFFEFEPGEPGRTVLQLEQSDVTKLQDLQFNFYTKKDAR